MSENPFAAPESSGRAIGVRSGKAKDVLAVARYQRYLILCILVYMASVGVQVAVTFGAMGAINNQQAAPAISGVMLAVSIGVLLAWLCGAVCVLLLAMKVYQPVVGVLLCVLALIPCVGLLILLLVNSRATKIIRDNGYSVGLLGANVAEIEAGLQPAGNSLDEE